MISVSIIKVVEKGIPFFKKEGFPKFSNFQIPNYSGGVSQISFMRKKSIL